MVQDYWPSPISMKAENVIISVAGLCTVIFLYLTITSTETVQDENNWQISDVCLDDHNSLATHEHVQLTIIINGTQVEIGPNIGIGDPGCDGMKGIHTHDDSGRLHIETPSPMPAPLGAFFEIWGESFSEQQILGHYADNEHEVVLKINGEVNSLYEEYLMKDGDIVDIEYRSK
tara:strand:+ start:407 stop:928 length:522 start_codon:yes stop_codon:yes gene_type:complete